MGLLGVVFKVFGYWGLFFKFGVIRDCFLGLGLLRAVFWVWGYYGLFLEFIYFKAYFEGLGNLGVVCWMGLSFTSWSFLMVRFFITSLSPIAFYQVVIRRCSKECLSKINWCLHYQWLVLTHWSSSTWMN